MQQVPLVLLDTTAGLFQLDHITQEVQSLGLQRCSVGHITYDNGQVLASCPVPDEHDVKTGGC